MAETYNAMVNHLTRVILKLVDEPMPYDIIHQAPKLDANVVRTFGQRLSDRADRVAGMMDLLAEKGFVFSSAKDCIFADSEEVEAQVVKKYLKDNGFQDYEFQVYLEYVRKWGVM